MISAEKAWEKHCKDNYVHDIEVVDGEKEFLAYTHFIHGFEAGQKAKDKEEE